MEVNKFHWLFFSGLCSLAKGFISSSLECLNPYQEEYVGVLHAVYIP